MGVVYKAEDIDFDRPVALKFIAANLIKDAEATIAMGLGLVKHGFW